MSIQRSICLAAIVLAPALSFTWLAPAGGVMAATPEWEVTNSGTAQQPPSALVARMFGVTMLEFRTDHPLHEVRVTVNGTVLGSLSISAVDNQTTLKLAAVVSQRQ